MSNKDMTVTESETLINDFESIDGTLTDFLKGKTVAISGATGFIGSLLARYLIWANNRYDLGLNLLLIARNKAKLNDLLPNLVNRDDVAVYLHDFSKSSDPLNTKFDYLVHTAAITTSRIMIERPVDVLDVSFNGAKWALDSAKKYPSSKVLYLSSMEACGHFDKPTIADENTLGTIDLTSVRSCYPEGKRISELMCLAYTQQYDVNVTVGRLAQTFGAGILPSEGRVFKQFAMSVVNDEPIVLHTDGLSEGNYVYSTDAVAAILTLLERGETGTTYNIANEDCHTTIRDMAQMVVNSFGGEHTELIIENADANKFGYAAPTKMLLSSNKLRELGWKPTVTLKEAYRKTIRFLIENRTRQEEH